MNELASSPQSFFRHLRSHEGIIAICQPGIRLGPTVGRWQPGMDFLGMANKKIPWLDGKFQTEWIFRIYTSVFFGNYICCIKPKICVIHVYFIYLYVPFFFVFCQSPKCVKLLLHHFLVLVELFQVLNALERNVGPLRLFTMNCISQDAHLSNPTTKTQSFWNEKTEKTPFFVGNEIIHNPIKGHLPKKVYWYCWWKKSG